MDGNRSDSVEGLIKKLRAFRDRRDWQRFHNPKDIAIAVNVEASELLELFLWSGNSAELSSQTAKDAGHEIADILIYLIYLCDSLGFDILDLVNEKILINEQRFA